MVERGKLNLESPASEWVPDLAEFEILEGFDAEGVPRTRKPKRAITLRHLLTHTAGFGYTWCSQDILRYQRFHKLPDIVTGKNAALRLPLLFEPGEKWNYGISIDFVGKAVEAVSGRKLGEAMKENLLEPLGMRDTAFNLTASMRQRLTKVHKRGKDNKLTPLMDFEVEQEPEFEVGGGGLYSTASDYISFIRMFLNQGAAHGRQILMPETVKTMSENHIGAKLVCPLETSIPPVSSNVDLFPGMPKKWGLGFLINTEQAPSGRSAGSLAWAGLANTYFWIDPIKGLGGVYLSQVFPFCDKTQLSLYDRFETSVYESTMKH
jgi:methyl acetate hydrolase